MNGRPLKTATIHVKVEPELKSRITRAADTDERSMSEWMRQAAKIALAVASEEGGDR